MSIDWNYVLKRVLVGVLIFISIFLLKKYVFLQVHAQTNTYNATTSCVFSSSTGSSSESCKTPPNTVVGGDEVNIWFTQSTLLQPSTTYFLEFRVKIIGLDSNVSQFNQYGVRATKIFTGNNGTASSEAYPDRNENFSFYHTDRNTAYLVWTFELDSLSTFNTIRISFFTGAQVGSIGGVMYTQGGIESATLRITGDQSSSGGSSSFDDTGIINNANDNANNIINNNNQNTQNIINSNNSNTQEIKDSIDESLGDCIAPKTIHPTFTNVGLYRSGDIYRYDNNSSNSGAYLDISAYVGKSITITFSNMDSSHTPRVNYCFADVSAGSTRRDCLGGLVRAQNITSATYTDVVPENSKYVYFVGYNSYIDQNWVNNVSISLPKTCISKIDKTTDAVKDMNDTMKDDSINANTGNDFFDNFNYGDDSLAGVITAPLRFFNKLTDSCSPITLNVLGQNVVLPCGDTLFWNRNDVSTFKTFWNILFGGAILYTLSLKLYKVIHDAIDPQKDNIESVGV